MSVKVLAFDLLEKYVARPEFWMAVGAIIFFILPKLKGALDTEMKLENDSTADKLRKRNAKLEKMNKNLRGVLSILDENRPDIDLDIVGPDENAPDGWSQINDKLIVRQKKKKRRNEKHWFESSYDLKKRKIDVHKNDVNVYLRDKIKEIYPNLPKYLQQNPEARIFLLDAPTYVTTQSLIEAFPSLRCSSQVVISQYDLSHYVNMIQNPELSVSVRAQRLDYFLHVNKNHKLHFIFAFFDYEQHIMGNLKKNLCPALDIRRYFQFGYPRPDGPSIFALTLETHSFDVVTIGKFVEFEAERYGYSATLIKRWKYHCYCFVWKIVPHKEL